MGGPYGTVRQGPSVMTVAPRHQPFGVAQHLFVPRWARTCVERAQTGSSKLRPFAAVVDNAFMSTEPAPHIDPGADDTDIDSDHQDPGFEATPGSGRKTMRQSSSAVAVGIAIGAAVGASLGLVADNIGVGLGVGIAIGAAIGAVVGQRD